MKRKKVTKRVKKASKQKQASVLPIVLCGTLLFSSAFGFGLWHITQAQAEIQEDPNLSVAARTLSLLLKHDALDLAPIILCESAFRHYNLDGTVLQNAEGSSAVGVAQIMSSVHPDPKVIFQYNKQYGTEIAVEDFNLDTFEGNLEYAIVLYRVRGVVDWKCSSQV